MKVSSYHFISLVIYRSPCSDLSVSLGITLFYCSTQKPLWLIEDIRSSDLVEESLKCTLLLYYKSFLAALFHFYLVDDFNRNNSVMTLNVSINSLHPLNSDVRSPPSSNSPHV